MNKTIKIIILEIVWAGGAATAKLAEGICTCTTAVA